jgi:hypothetical protein
MPTINIKPILRKILTSNWSAPDIKVYLWYWLIAGPEYREAPITPEVISKISHATGLTDKNTSLSLRILGLLPPSNDKPSLPPPDPATNQSINSDRVKNIVQFWTDCTGIQLTISEKLDIATWCDKVSEVHSDMPDRITNFLKYQLAFQGVTNVDRAGAYLFRYTFRSFFNNYAKFGADFDYVLTEHQMRYKTYKEKPVHYGFSTDPIEDRKLAAEDELENICLALDTTGKYENPIVFPDNMAYYQKRLKKIEKKKEKST